MRPHGRDPAPPSERPEELRERAQAARLSMGAYLRRRALGQRVRMAAELRLGKGGSTNLHRAYASPAYGSQS